MNETPDGSVVPLEIPSIFKIILPTVVVVELVLPVKNNLTLLLAPEMLTSPALHTLPLKSVNGGEFAVAERSNFVARSCASNFWFIGVPVVNVMVGVTLLGMRFTKGFGLFEATQVVRVDNLVEV